MPTPPPTPRRPDISPMAPDIRSGLSTPRRTATPIGNSANDSPCNVRPITNGTRLFQARHSTDPASTRIRMVSNTPRAPRRSANRPRTGVHTAAARRFAVKAQATADGPTSSCSVMAGRSGTTDVCTTAVVITMKHNEGTSARLTRGAVETVVTIDNQVVRELRRSASFPFEWWPRDR